MAATSGFGGHIVQGHVDGTGEFLEAKAAGNGWAIRIGFLPELARYIDTKGYLALPVYNDSVTLNTLTRKKYFGSLPTTRITIRAKLPIFWS